MEETSTIIQRHSNMLIRLDKIPQWTMPRTVIKLVFHYHLTLKKATLTFSRDCPLIAYRPMSAAHARTHIQE